MSETQAIGEFGDSASVSEVRGATPQLPGLAVLSSLRLAAAAVFAQGGIRVDAATEPVVADYGIYAQNNSTYQSVPLGIRDRGWALAQALSNRQSVAVETPATDDELLVEPPSPSLWESLPKSRWQP